MYEKTNSKTFHLRLSSDDLDYIKYLADINGKSASEIIRMLIRSVRLRDFKEGCNNGEIQK